jgi:phosphatidate cytidylyltransferase
LSVGTASGVGVGGIGGAHRHRRSTTPLAAAAAASGAGAAWPAATPAAGGGPSSSSFEPEPAAQAAAQRVDLAASASAAAAALETAASEAERDAAADLSSSSSASFASASSASLSSADSAVGAATEAAAGTTPPKKASGGGGGLAKRVASGVLLGTGGAAVVAAGGVPFLCAALFVTYHATREFYGLLTSRGLSKGMTPPGPIVSASTTLLCMSIALLTHATARGRSGVAMAVAGFVLLSLNLFSSPKPKFAQLTSSLFGLFYCGYLPSFWIKLRAVAAPLPADAPIAALLPSWLASGGGATVGLAVTLTAVACVIAADTGAYFVGKSLGRTKLTDISPKKTVEGAFGGLLSSVAVALGLQALLTGWPAVPVAAAAAAGLHFPQAAVPWAAPLLAAAFGAAVFVSSILGDLIESIIKREAGLKDSGDLIPGHGGLLDRFDSYIFTGAVAYGFVVFGHLF